MSDRACSKHVGYMDAECVDCCPQLQSPDERAPAVPAEPRPDPSPSPAGGGSPAVRPLVPDGPRWWWRDDEAERVVEGPDGDLWYGRYEDVEVKDDGHWRGPCLSLADVEAARVERDADIAGLRSDVARMEAERERLREALCFVAETLRQEVIEDDNVFAMQRRIDAALSTKAADARRSSCARLREQEGER